MHDPTRLEKLRLNVACIYIYSTNIREYRNYLSRMGNLVPVGNINLHSFDDAETAWLNGHL